MMQAIVWDADIEAAVQQIESKFGHNPAIDICNDCEQISRTSSHRIACRSCNIVRLQTRYSVLELVLELTGTRLREEIKNARN